MAKKLSAAVVAGQESLSAAVARVEQASLTLSKDHGIIESGVQVLREKIDDLEDQAAKDKETYDKAIFDLRNSYEKKIANLEAQVDYYSRIHGAIKNELNKPLQNQG